MKHFTAFGRIWADQMRSRPFECIAVLPSRKSHYQQERRLDVTDTVLWSSHLRALAAVKEGNINRMPTHTGLSPWAMPTPFIGHGVKRCKVFTLLCDEPHVASRRTSQTQILLWRCPHGRNKNWENLQHTCLHQWSVPVFIRTKLSQQLFNSPFINLPTVDESKSEH